ncbi:MAG: Holliday junction resolvase RuvX [Planctomycetaceae bacterium]
MNGSSDDAVPSRGESDAAPPVPFPERGRLLGMDYGTKRVGVALSNPDQTIASPLETWEGQDEAQEERRLKTLVEDYGVAGLVIGLPVHMSGAEGGMAAEARAFGKYLAAVTGLPVRFWDERFTSIEADEHLLSADLSRKKRKGIRDRLAAQILLQNYLDAPDRERSPGTIRD